MFNQAFLLELDQLLARHNISRSMQKDKIVLVDMDAGRQDFSRYARNYGLEPGDYGAIVQINRSRYKVIGIKTGRPRYPFEIECMGTGKHYKGPRDLASQIIAGRATRSTAPTQPTPSPAPAPSASQSNVYAALGQF